VTGTFSALFYTLFETAKLSRVDPRAYVTRAATLAIQNSGTVILPSGLTCICADSDPEYFDLCLASRRATASTYR